MINIINYDKDIKDTFDGISKDKQRVITEIIANLNYKKSHEHIDSNHETIKITLRELNDCLAYCLINYFNGSISKVT